MLKSLTVKNIALIKHAEVDFAAGFNVLTGETGAGKSILIDSLGFALGQRADKNLIRHGADKAEVEAVFTTSATIGKKLSEEYGIEVDDEVIIRREIAQDAAGSIRVNGVRITAGMLKSLAAHLADIYGQHETHELFNESSHIKILDSFSPEIPPAKLKTAECHTVWRAALDKQKKLGTLEDIAKRQDYLGSAIKELAAAKLKDGEEEELDKTRRRLNNTEIYLTALGHANELLSGFDNDSNALSSISAAMKQLSGVSDLQDELPEFIERMDSVKIELSDISNSIGALLSSAEFDEDLARRCEDRKQQLRSLKQRYKAATVEELIQLLQKYRQEEQLLQNAEDAADRVQKEVELAFNNLDAASQKLSAARKKATKQLEAALCAELAGVGMTGAAVEVKFGTAPHTATGCDEVAFYCSLNKGQPLKPLSKTVSGGEASRFMLCIKSLIANLEGVNTMVFDEVDTGVSGNTALKVAQKLCKIARGRQVLCVTHLPQPAAYAHAHFLIKKQSDAKSTYTQIVKLDKQGEIDELSRLVGAQDGSKFVRQAAEEMKQLAKRDA